MALRIEDLIDVRTTEPFVTLPPELEAREPAEVRGRSRDDVRLLVTRGREGRSQHARFTQLPEFLDSGDLLVLNASATLPAALDARTASGDSVVFHVSTRLPGGLCVVELRGQSAQESDILSLADGATLTLLARYRDSRRLWMGRFDGVQDVISYLYRWGKPIAYRHVRGEWPIEAYQNVYATVAGSAEMPSAGRPITREMLGRLRKSGTRVAHVLLHTGVSSPERDEPPYEESFDVPHETAALVAQTRAAGRRVIAVGTTVVRALESAADGRGRIVAAKGWTDLVITPQRGLKFVDGMLTGFHEPRSSHLSLLETLVGKQHVDQAYAAALAGRYLWHEFGDSHLLLAL
jgi:S-adenosylmethionine:tRNA ribosyltransferase-isomerase